MTSRVSVAEAASQLGEFVNRVVRDRETFVLIREGMEVAELRPLARRVRAQDLPSILRSLPPLSPDEAGAFSSDLDEARIELGKLPTNDPWES